LLEESDETGSKPLLVPMAADADEEESEEEEADSDKESDDQSEVGQLCLYKYNPRQRTKKPSS